MFLPYNGKVIANAKRLRRGMTEEEKKLWYQYLSGYPVRFLRQKVVENCILDFYCAQYKLGIEVDGGQHHTEGGLAHDEETTRYLNGYGIRILRFSNEQVRDAFGAVCRQIDRRVNEILAELSGGSLPTRP